MGNNAKELGKNDVNELGFIYNHIYTAIQIIVIYEEWEKIDEQNKSIHCEDNLYIIFIYFMRNKLYIPPFLQLAKILIDRSMDSIKHPFQVQLNTNTNLDPKVYDWICV